MPATLSPLRRQVRPSRVGILFVDDEEAVRAAAAASLTRGGFRVWSANSGREAVEVYRQDGVAIDLVVLDLEMPGLNGVDTMAELRELNPNLRCCLMTNYPSDYSPEEREQLDIQEVFAKPFRPEELVTTLREMTMFDR